MVHYEEEEAESKYKNVREACQAISLLMENAYLKNPYLSELTIIQLAASVKMLADIIGQTDIGNHPVKIASRV